MRTSHTPVIETKDLCIGYPLKRGKRKIVHDGLNLRLYAGEVTCLLGLNGAGKSTLLRTLCGFHLPLGGEVYLQGKPLKQFSQNNFSRIVSVVLTEKTNAGGISVYDLVSLGRHPYTGFFGRLREEDHYIIKESLEAVGIVHKSENNVSELSDGERQKVMIAKALAQQSPIILLDEPTAFLDVTSRIETMMLLHKLAKEQNKAILLSTHDIDLAIQTGDCFWLQNKNKPMACGTPEDLILNGTVGEFFEKDGIIFDISTGKLNTEMPINEIGVEGDFTTSYWMGNALLRNGFRPSSVKEGQVNIRCMTKDDIRISYSGEKEKTAKDIYEALQLIKNFDER